MKQVLQDLKTGETLLAELPCPMVKAGHLLIRTRASLISLGTERMLVSFAKAGLLAKARQQPEKVRQVLAKVKTDGLFATIDAVRARLDVPMPLGYCNAGEVLEVGAGVEGFQPGDRVASNGAHAEVVCVPKNLCAKIPDGVPFDQACFAVAGAIALQGVRLLQPTLGERIVVTGLGLIGLLAAQILRAHGCIVLGVDFDRGKCQLARDLGLAVTDVGAGEDVLAAARAFTQGAGVDGVLVTASTSSSDPMNQAAEMCRKRGRIVQVGATGLELKRDALYKKELSVQISCSYGPGRYDPDYEDKGGEYPLPYVRWTEQRNFAAVLDLLVAKALRTDVLTTHRFSIERAPEAYAEVVAGAGALGIVLEYPVEEGKNLRVRTIALAKPAPAALGQIVVGAIGAGVFGARHILPELQKAGVRLHTIASAGGMSGTVQGGKAGFERSTTEVAEIFGNPEINTVVITTQHNTHAKFVLAALRAGQRVFVEKPLCLTAAELAEIREVYAAAANPFLLVGFNRRFAPQIVRMKELLARETEPKAMVITVNAGVLPDDHWHHQAEAGGGRILAEGCHFIDLVRFLAGHPIAQLQAMAMGANASLKKVNDKATISMRAADGTIGTVHYLGNGSKEFPKERIEVFVGGKVLQVDNFRALRGFGFSGFRALKSWRQDKGHAAEIAAFVAALREGKPSPIPSAELFEVAELTLTAAEQAGR